MNEISKKGMVPTIVLAVVLSIFVGCIFFTDEEFAKPNNVYQIYLDGEKIGLIEDKDELYNLINVEQGEIKSTYSVDQVYPPNGFSIEKYTTYKDDVTTVSDIYNKIKEEKNFTIKGYTITVKPQKPETNNEEKEIDYSPRYIYVLDKDIFDQAITNFINTFVGETNYKNYKNGTQPEVVDVGQIINNMYFQEVITIKESYISVEEQIFTNVEDLTHYLLYGANAKEDKYVIKKGDTVSSVAESHKLNDEEFLIANPDIADANTILPLGKEVTIALIDPQLTLIYEAEVTIDQEVPYETETRVDYSKYYGYKQVIQQGVTGIERITKIVQVQNGAENSGAFIDNDKVITIRAAQKEIISVGRKVDSISQPIIDPNTTWQWPTNPRYVITSPFGYRWGELHNGMDISGTGKGSPIYSVLEGEVISAQWGGILGRNAGNNVVIRHDNGYYSSYAHLNSINVKAGDRVSAKQKIGTMGETGYAFGVHLHLSISIGQPYSSGYKWIDPKTLWNMK